MPLTTFIIPSIGRPTLQRAIDSTKPYPHIYMIDKKKEDGTTDGPSKLRNRMILQATTEWVSFLDDDDTVTPDYVDRLAEELFKHPEADVIHFREYFIDNGHLLPSRNTVAWGNIGICFSVKRELALEHPFKTEPYEDFEFVKRLHKLGKKVIFSPYIVYRARH